MTAIAEDIYFTATGEEDGRPLIFRSLKAVPAGVTEADLPTRVSVTWRYVSDSGMPDAEDNNAQIDFEDALEPLDENGTSRLMLVVTGNGRKEWHWYVRDLESWMDQFNRQLADQPCFPLDIANTYEPGWDLYKDFIENVSGF